MKIFGIEIPSEVTTSLLIIIINVIINYIIKSLINKIIKLDSDKTKHEQRRKRTLLRLLNKVIRYVIIVITVLSVMSTFHINTTALVTSVGALSVVVGLAFQDVLKDFLVGAAVIIEDQFSVGDFVLINGYKGDVVGFSLKSTKIKAISGEVTIISNREITEVTNYSLSKTKMFIDISVSYEDDNNKVEKVLNDICEKLEKNYKEISEIGLYDGIDELSSSSVNYKLFALVSIRDTFFAKRVILKEVKETFDKNNIKIPYPQIEVHNEK